MRQLYLTFLLNGFLNVLEVAVGLIVSSVVVDSFAVVASTLHRVARK